jgi:hypothetical protein
MSESLWLPFVWPLRRGSPFPGTQLEETSTEEGDENLHDWKHRMHPWTDAIIS